jgi:hypothetical protein
MDCEEPALKPETLRLNGKADDEVLPESGARCRVRYHNIAVVAALIYGAVLIVIGLLSLHASLRFGLVIVSAGVIAAVIGYGVGRNDQSSLRNVDDFEEANREVVQI